MDPKKLYQLWCKKAEDAEIKAVLAAMTEEDIQKYFSAPLDFGTAGLRGIMTAGIGAINLHTVRRATYGAGCYFREKNPKRPVVIASDTRLNSRRFAEETAGVLAALGIPVLLFDGARPTPELSFAVRKLACAAGINITASHNPKTYNGYKVYAADGAQISGDEAAEISERIGKIDYFDVPVMPFAEAVKAGLVTELGADFDEQYMAEVLRCSVMPEADRSLRIVYTPLHGAGGAIVPKLLEHAGFSDVTVVEAQRAPDGNFPNAPSPNPEFEAAFALGIAQAKENGASLVLANDPDADRAGAAIRTKDGEFRVLNGNQIGAILLEYILSARQKRGTMPARAPFVVRSIVSTPLADRICAAYGVSLRLTPTGFKFIGAEMNRGDGCFLFGFEESNGYLAGDYARDKDGVLAVMLLSEAAACYGGLDAALEAIYARYGCYRELTENLRDEAIGGHARMAAKMQALRDRPFESINGCRVTFADYQGGGPIADGRAADSKAVRDNMVSFAAESFSVFIRPSGTEPKIKVYVHAHASSMPEADAAARAVMSEVVARIHALK